MIIKIVKNNGEELGVFLYENNENGEVFIQDTYHCDAYISGLDTIFGTNEEQVVINIGGNEMTDEKICDKIENAIFTKFENLNCFSNDYNNETNILSLTFIDDGEPEDEFFDKMKDIYKYVKHLEYNAELIKFPRNCEYNYSEAKININIYGGELY